MYQNSLRKCRLTLASLLLACTGQLYCGGPSQNNPAVSQAILDVQITGSDYGSVSSAPAGIDCGTTCRAAYNLGTTVTLTATTLANASFVSWGGSCQGTAPTCTVTLAQATLVTAQFMRSGVALTVNKSGDGTGTVSSQPNGISCGSMCLNGFDAGTLVTLTATPDAGSQFVGWSGACSGSAPTCEVTMDAAKQVNAQFHSPAPTVTSVGPFYVSKAGGTQVVITGTGFQSGSQVTIGGAAATGVIYVSPTQLKATVPAGTQAGCAAVLVTNPNSMQGGASKALAYQPTSLSFAAATTTAVAASPAVARAADFDRDGKLDLLVATGSGKVQFLQGAGDGTFAAAADVLTDQGLTGLELADVNRDGKMDALAVSGDNSKVFILLGNGDGTFTTASSYDTGMTPYGLAVADVSGDGYHDLVIANNGASNVSVLLGNGDGSFNAKSDYAVGAPVQAVKLGDVNNDTYQDIVTAASDGNTYVLLGNGDGTFQAATSVNVGGNLKDVALGDAAANSAVTPQTLHGSGQSYS